MVWNSYTFSRRQILSSTVDEWHEYRSLLDKSIYLCCDVISVGCDGRTKEFLIDALITCPFTFKPSESDKNFRKICSSLRRKITQKSYYNETM